jgi:type III restriction enzyme
MFASLLEKDLDVKKWFKPTRDQFAISYRDSSGSTSSYEPDFIVETADEKYIIEPKQASMMGDANVLAKKDAAVAWCLHASEHEVKHNGKKWRYILIPHTSILPSATLSGLIRQYSSI